MVTFEEVNGGFKGAPVVLLGAGVKMILLRYTSTHLPTKDLKTIFMNVTNVEGALDIPKFIA